MGAGYGQKSDIACPLDGFRDLSLMLGAVAGNSARNYFATLGNEVAQRAWVLVINGNLLVCAETANLTALKRSFLPWPARAL